MSNDGNTGPDWVQLRDVVKNDPKPEGEAAKIAQEDAARNEQNEEGHSKNLEKIERDAERAQENTKPAGRVERNGNTPIVNKDGSKSWA